MFVLDPKLQGGPKQPACREQFIGYSKQDLTTICLGSNLSRGFYSPGLHVVHDDHF